jgi:glycerol-3-phosphate dehydrogenase
MHPSNKHNEAGSTQGLSRDRTWQALHEQPTWDICVVGGGATGLGTALDAAARGFSVVLAEAEDFASGASSRSSKMLHGGVRYLQQLDFALVKEALHERATVLVWAALITSHRGISIRRQAL